jgi:hypothetical protein
MMSLLNGAWMVFGECISTNRSALTGFAEFVNNIRKSPSLPKASQAAPLGRVVVVKSIQGYLSVLAEKKDCLFFLPRRPVPSKSDEDGSLAGEAGWAGLPWLPVLRCKSTLINSSGEKNGQKPTETGQKICNGVPLPPYLFWSTFSIW